MSKRIIITLPDGHDDLLEKLMRDDMETNQSAYMARFIVQETKRRMEVPANVKRAVGRPKKSDEVEDTNRYPAPYEGGGVYTALELGAWYEFDSKRGKMPPLPAPLSAKEIKKYEK